MGFDVLLWIWLLTWMVKTAATDVLYAAKGKPNPRYELKKQKALAAGKPAAGPARYGTRDWLADLYSDALAAHTEKRRAKPAGGTDKPVKVTPEEERPEPVSTSVVHRDDQTYVPHLPGDPKCPHGPEKPADPPPAADAAAPPTTNQPLATVIPMFPIMKESTMSNAEVTGLPTAIAFAKGMANAHRAAATAGGEQYVAALRGFDVGDGAISTVEHAREMSQQAAAAWERAAAEMQKQTTVGEAYRAVPDAGNKRFVTGE